MATKKKAAKKTKKKGDTVDEKTGRTQAESAILSILAEVKTESGLSLAEAETALASMTKDPAGVLEGLVGKGLLYRGGPGTFFATTDESGTFCFVSGKPPIQKSTPTSSAQQNLPWSDNPNTSDAEEPLDDGQIEHAEVPFASEHMMEQQIVTLLQQQLAVLERIANALEGGVQASPEQPQQQAPQMAPPTTQGTPQQPQQGFAYQPQPSQHGGYQAQPQGAPQQQQQQAPQTFGPPSQGAWATPQPGGQQPQQQQQQFAPQPFNGQGFQQQPQQFQQPQQQFQQQPNGQQAPTWGPGWGPQGG